MARAILFLSFPGNCAEAMKFYQKCMGGKLEILTVAQTPMAKESPAHMQDKVMHAMLKNDNLVFYAADLFQDEPKSGNRASAHLECSSEKEIKSLFAQLSEGGKVAMPLDKPFWSDFFGALEDKFGISWTFNFDSKGRY